MKNRKLKSKDFFDVEHNPLITFHSTKVEQTGPNTVAFDGDFHDTRSNQAGRGTSTLPRDRTGVDTVNGTMAFDRKQLGMNSGIPFIKIADRVR